MSDFTNSVNLFHAANSSLDTSATPISFAQHNLSDLEIRSLSNRSSFENDALSLESPRCVEPAFTSGWFTVGSIGQVCIDYLYDGGAFEGDVGIFSLKGLESFLPGSIEFTQAVVQRILSNSTWGHLIISDTNEGSRLESNFNAGDYLGVKTFAMNPGDHFGVMLIPNGSITELVQDPTLDGSKRPLFSLSSANPSAGFQFGQIADVTGNGSTFAFEDLRIDGESDRDYEDIIFQIRGAIGFAGNLNEMINSDNDWRNSAMGQAILNYIAPYDNPIDFQTSSYTSSQATQPLIGIIDTGSAANNPDIDYNRIILGRDYVDGDNNPLLVPGEGNEHGTHILGIIGATRNNGIGIDGMNDQAPIWLGRAIGSGKWAESLVEFVNQKLDSNQPNGVLNLSLDLSQRNSDGSITTRYEFTPEERVALEYARQSGVLIVVAAGNDGGAMSALGQASQEFDNIITVGAADGQNRTNYSSYGYGLDILAPGGTTEKGILSTVADGVGTLAGTSVATAHVTGAISQVWAANPGLNYRQVIEILKLVATDVGEPNWDFQTGAGLVNVTAAVELAKATAPKVHDAPASLVPQTWTGERQVTPIERAVGPFNYSIRNESFSGTVGPDIGVNLRYSPWFGDRSSRNEPSGKQLQFDAWTYGERGTDLWLGSPDELWYRVAGTNLWVPSAYIYGYPGSRPPVLAPALPNPNPNPSTDPQPIPFVPINSNSPNYRNGALNPYAYNSGLIGQCTWYAYGRMRETGLLSQGGISGALFRSHAYKWTNDATKLNLPITSTPEVGARGLVVWPPGVRGSHSQYGHVAFLEEVYPDGRVRISESNWGGAGIKERILTPAQYSGVQFIQLENARAGSVPPAAIPGKNQQYIIKAGDTLSGIAQRYLGNANRWREIMKNPTGGTFTDAEARTLQVGQSVYLPVNLQLPLLPTSPPIPKPDPTPSSTLGSFDGRERVDDGGWKKVLDARNNDFRRNPPQWWEVPGQIAREAAHIALLNGNWVGQDDAAEMLANYLNENNGGANYTIDLDEAIRETPSYRSWLSENMVISSARAKILQAVQQGYQRGTVGNNWLTAHRSNWGDLNWQAAIGGHHARYVADFEVDPNASVLTLKVQFFLKDVYDFASYDEGEPVLGSHGLHLAGYARAFEVTGESKVYEWKFSMSSGGKIKDGFGDDMG